LQAERLGGLDLAAPARPRCSRARSPPRKAALLRISAAPAAIQGLMSSPRMGAPKKIRKSCSSSGVPWNTWM
jgi:hypothetical protein